MNNCISNGLYFIDGQVLTPDDFGEYDGSGVWIPKTPEELEREFNIDDVQYE